VLNERVRRRVIRGFKRRGFLDATVAADMLAWEHSGFSVDASVGITLIDRDVPSYFHSFGASSAVLRAAALRTGAALRRPW
jgi:hypothetical protein